MKVTFGQWDSSGPEALEASFAKLQEYLSTNDTDLILLPELPFDSWFCSLREFERERWEKSIRIHDEWIDRLRHLPAKYVAATKPLNDSENRNNVAWIFDNTKSELQLVHGKRYLPNEEGFWEANWYSPADISFDVYELQRDVRIGFMICTDMWFMKHARDYAANGIDLLLVPRSTPVSTVDKWVTGGQTAAVISGAYTFSSNHCGMGEDKETTLGGVGFAVDPDGRLLLKSSADKWWRTIDVDLNESKEAKSTYPRYVIG